jgi:hypothetical protein
VVGRSSSLSPPCVWCTQVVGLDRTNSTKAAVVREMILGHYLALLKKERYKHCIIRVFIEANMSFIDADRIAVDLQAMDSRRIDVVRFDPECKENPRYGVWTNANSKQAQAEELVRCVPDMAFVEPHLAVSRDWEGNITELLTQLKKYRKVIDQPKTQTGASSLHYKAFYTGKGGAGSCDDYVSACGIALQWMYHTLLRDEAFLQRCTAEGKACSG